MRSLTRIALAVAVVVAWSAAPAGAQFIPYFGKNKVRYDSFAWRVYKSPHFEIYYYPELEPHLTRVASYAESAYQKVSADLKHSIEFSIPIVLYKTHSEFEQTNLFPDFVSEGILAFAEPTRDRLVLPIDEPSDRLQGLITHELTHIFEFDIVPRNLISRDVPQWVDEGLSDFERGVWDDLDLMMIRDAAVTDQIPPMSHVEDLGQFSNPRVVYNLGHAAFEFIEARWGKEGIRQFLYTFRKNIANGGNKAIYDQAFRIKPDEFDKAFDRWLKERFKPYRDKQVPTDYGPDLAPNAEETQYAGVYAFSPAPSGEIIAALTGNRRDQKVDLVLLSAKDGAVVSNLTSGYTQKYEDIEFNREFTAGRSISFSPDGDHIAFFARKGKKRTLFLASALSGKIVRQVPIDLDEAQAPCLLADGRRVLFSALKDGISDIYLLDLETGHAQNLTQDSFSDNNPQISPDGTLVVYDRRISGHVKLYSFPLADPSHKTQLTFGTFDDVAPSFSRDGRKIYYSSSEDDDIPNLRSLELATGIVRHYTDVLGANMAPAHLPGGKGPERVAFISYYKGKYLLNALELQEPLKEIEQDIQTIADVDFEPDVRHQVVPENKRRKGVFEKLSLEGHPPLNVGITSSGDFFGGSQAVLSDVLSDHTFALTVASLREFRSYDLAYVNQSRRLHYGITAFDDTAYFYASPYSLDPGFSRQGAIATRRSTGALFGGSYPLSKFTRIEVSGGVFRQREQFENSDAEELAREQAAALGLPFIFNNGTIAPLSVNLVGETTRFREYGPLTGDTFLLGAEVSPSIGSLLHRTTLQVDARHYQRIIGDMVLAARFRGFRSTGQNPAIFYFGGDMELRGYPYLSLSGNEGFHANLELRFPIIDLMKTPIGIFGPVRGTLYGGIGGAHYQGESYQFATTQDGVSYVNNNLFGDPVSGRHLIDGRASYGLGVEAFLFGLPMHFDWTKLTDLKISSPTRFDFWVGFDF